MGDVLFDETHRVDHLVALPTGDREDVVGAPGAEDLRGSVLEGQCGDRARELAGEPRRGTEELPCHVRTIRLEHHTDHGTGAGDGSGDALDGDGLLDRVGERVAGEQRFDRGMYLLVERTGQHRPRPLDAVHAHGPDPRRAAVGAPRAGAPGGATEVRSRERAEVRRVDRRASFRRHLAGVDEPFRARGHDGQIDLELGPAVVVFAPEMQGLALHAQVAHTGRERQVEQLGQLRADLAGVGVDGVAAEEHEVERSLVLDRCRERARRREGVGTGERGIGDEHSLDGDCVLRAPRDGLTQHVLRGGRAEREHRDHAVADRSGQLDRLRDGAAAVGVHLEVEAVALQPPVRAELQLREGRDLLHEGGDAHLTTMSGFRGRVPHA